ncbi:ATP-dependent DNA helicase RecQ-like [Ptychodera flava]|uniref:ATP-dependent DNA helicase RecQ-like n=1 Tax=Ptychodera flava TaxID=63121 RepID=UPI00396AA506
MTATATNATMKEIGRCLMLKQPVKVTESVDRQNIKITVKKRPPNSGGNNTVQGSYNTIFQPLIEELRAKGDKFARTIVYTNLRWCGYAHDLALRPCLSGDFSFPDITNMVAQYHASCTDKMKTAVLQDMTSPSSSLRLLFATEAYGMGADAVDVTRIIHAGPPRTLETYVQEIGRAGRDGMPAEAILYYNASDIASNVAGMTCQIRDFCLTNTCRRENLIQNFGQHLHSKFTYSHECCDNCEKSCQCATCLPKIFIPHECTSGPVLSGRQPSVVTETDILSCQSVTGGKYYYQKVSEVHYLLMQYFRAENMCKPHVPFPSLVTGLTETLAGRISKQCVQYLTENKLISDFPFLDKKYVDNIISIISQVQSTPQNDQ